MLIDLDLNPTSRQLRQFGLIAFVAFCLAGTWLLRTGALFGWSFGGFARSSGYALILIGISSGLMALVWPRGNRLLFVLLAVLTFPLGLVISHLVMLFLFFAIITPIGMLFRAIGRDPLQRRWDRARESYWEDARESADVKDYFRQF